MSGNYYKNYLVTLLMILVAFSFVDRTVFSMVLQDIKVDLALTDTQLGVLNGFIIAMLFSLIGIPISRWTDRGHRVVLISVATAVCAVMVTLCSAVGSFTQLLLVRMGAAAGDAGSIPPANSLIPDYFSRAERPGASARFMLGVPLGAIIGYSIGGWLNAHLGWRDTFFVIGLPGLALAALAMLTLKEPRRLTAGKTTRLFRAVAAESIAVPSLKEAIVTLNRCATFRHMMMFYLAWYFSGWAFSQWLPTFFVRSHGMTTEELGNWMALVCGGSELFGTWLGGELTTRYAANNERLQFKILAVVFVINAICGAVVELTSNRWVAFAAMGVGSLGPALGYGALYATIQTLVPPRMRATALMLVGLLPTFIGMGLGPLAVGALSDALRPWAGEESLRYALLAICPCFLWAAWHLWRCSQMVTRDLAAQAEEDLLETNSSKDKPSIKLAIAE